MSDLLFDTGAPRHVDLLSSYHERESKVVKTWEDDSGVERTADGERFVEDVTGDACVVAEDVEGLPLSLVRLYADLAARHAQVKEVESSVFVATVAGLDGAWADGGTPERAMNELRDAIIGWVAVKRRVGADIPPIEGLDLNHKP